MTYLPWGRPGQAVTSPEASPAHVELLALIALAAATKRPPGQPFPTVAFQEMSHVVTQASGQLQTILELSHLRAAAAVDPTDQLGLIALMLRGQQVLVRHTSYAEMVENTVIQLFDANKEIRSTLIANLGVDGGEAIKALKACHDLQQKSMN